MPPRYDEEPQFIRLEAGQNTDAEHPREAGVPAYRAVYKTLRVVLGPTDLNWPNLRVRFGQGSVERGGAEIRNAHPGRRPRQWLLLEQSGLVPRDGGTEFEFRSLPNVRFELGGWENEVHDCWYVEFILDTEETDWDARLAEGRSKLAPIKTMIDLQFGQRVLGVPLTEELGERHADGHWSRALRSDLVASETYFSVGAIPVQDLDAFARGAVARHADRPIEEKLRLRLACDWYQSAPQHTDAVLEYLHLWFVLEALCMPSTTDIRPIKRRLGQVLGGDNATWGPVVGRHFGRRSRLVHGEGERRVDEDDLKQLRAIVDVLLAADMGVDPPPPAVELLRPS